MWIVDLHQQMYCLFYCARLITNSIMKTYTWLCCVGRTGSSWNIKVTSWWCFSCYSSHYRTCRWCRHSIPATADWRTASWPEGTALHSTPGSRSRTPVPPAHGYTPSGSPAWSGGRSGRTTGDSRAPAGTAHPAGPADTGPPPHISAHRPPDHSLQNIKLWRDSSVKSHLILDSWYVFYCYLSTKMYLRGSLLPSQVSFALNTQHLRPYKTKYLLSLELKMQHDEQGETLFNIIALIIHSTRCRWEMARRVNDETLHTAQRSAVIISAVPVLHCSQVFFTGFQI